MSVVNNTLTGENFREPARSSAIRMINQNWSFLLIKQSPTNSLGIYFSSGRRDKKKYEKYMNRNKPVSRKHSYYVPYEKVSMLLVGKANALNTVAPHF